MSPPQLTLTHILTWKGDASEWRNENSMIPVGLIVNDEEKYIGGVSTAAATKQAEPAKNGA